MTRNATTRNATTRRAHRLAASLSPNPVEFRTRRSLPAEIRITQPRGGSWHIEGNHVLWDKWRLRVGFNAREGLVLYNIGMFDPDSGHARPVARRVSFAEMIVPYGDPEDPHYRKNAFDAGEDGLGKVRGPVRALIHLSDSLAIVNAAAPLTPTHHRPR